MGSTSKNLKRWRALSKEMIGPLAASSSYSLAIFFRSGLKRLFCFGKPSTLHNAFLITIQNMQLPPVTKEAKSRRFAFETSAWGRCNLLLVYFNFFLTFSARCNLLNINLTQVKRQSDQRLVDLLNRVSGYNFSLWNGFGVKRRPAFDVKVQTTIFAKWQREKSFMTEAQTLGEGGQVYSRGL